MDVLLMSYSIDLGLFLSMLQSKIFTNGSTTVPKPVRDALGVQAGDTVRFFISDNCVQIIKAQSMTGTTVMLGRSSQS